MRMISLRWLRRAWPGWWWRRHRVFRNVRMVHEPPPTPADVQYLHLWDGGQLVGMLAYQVCAACQQGLICQISIYDAVYRNVGLGRRAIRHTQEQLTPGAAWSTSGQNPEARRCWRRMHLEMALGGRLCPHTEQALDGRPEASARRWRRWRRCADRGVFSPIGSCLLESALAPPTVT
jgi:hypothetical protein